MKTILVILALVTGGVFSIASVQEQNTVEKLGQKIDELQKRVVKLERIIYSTSQLSRLDAERRLTNAQETLEHSRQLRKKGFINDAQLKNDEFAVRQAEQELELATSSEDTAKQGAELELMNSEQDLIQARRELLYIEKLESRGFSTKYEVQRVERLVRFKERAVELAKQKLAAFESYEEMKPKPAAEK